MTVLARKRKGTLALVNPPTQNLIKSTSMSLTLTPSGGSLGCKYTISVYSGTLPAGLTLVNAGDNLSATVSGTPTADQGNLTISFLVVASSGERVATTGTIFHVADSLALLDGQDTATIVGMTKAVEFTYQLQVVGGRVGGAGWIKASGNYPSGSVAFSVTAAGLVTGTPDDDTDSEAITFTYTDANSTQITTATLTFVVNAVLSVTLGSQTWTADDSTETVVSIIATGGTEPIAFARKSGTNKLPEGMIITQDRERTAIVSGVITSGDPGNSITIEATDGQGSTNDTGLVAITIVV